MNSVLETYVAGNTFWHRMDNRVKIVSIFGFIIATTSLNAVSTLTGAVLAAVAFTIFAGIPFNNFINRVIWIIPFAGLMIIIFPFITPGSPAWNINLGFFTFTATYEGIFHAVRLLLKVLASVLVLIILTSTTSFQDLMKAFRHLKVPGIILSILEFAVRYLDILAEEADRMRTARKSRGFSPGKNFWHWKTMKVYAQLIGILFLRSYQRSDRIYLAMLSRGYNGDAKCCGHCRQINKVDYFYGLLPVSAILLLKLMELGVVL